MMNSKKGCLCLFLVSLIPLWATPESKIACACAYFFGYPALILSLFYFEKRKIRAIYCYGWGVCYFLVHMYWLGGAKYHGAGIFYVYLFFSSLFPIGFALFGYFFPKSIKDLTLFKMGELSLLFAFCEYLRLFVICGFPFHLVGLILSPFQPTRMLASLFGVYGLSFIVIFVSLMVAKAIALKRAATYCITVFLPILCGYTLYLTHFYYQVAGEKIDVAIVQTGLRVEEKWPLAGKEDCYIAIEEQVKSLWERLESLDVLDLICLPEATLGGDGYLERYTKKDLETMLPKDMIPFFYGKERFNHIDLFTIFSLYLHTDIAVGLIAEEKNSLFYFSKGKLLGVYVKHHLLPLGEYIPYDFLQPIARRYGLDGSFKQGSGVEVFKSKWNILPTICFDEGFPDYFLEGNKLDPQLHLNIHNDGWFIDSKLIESHFDIGRMRSVEQGIYSIRAGNVGVSALISPTGKVVKRLPLKEGEGAVYKGVLIESFIPYRYKTLFSYIGNCGWFFLIVFSLAIPHVIYHKNLIKNNSLE